MKAMLAEQIKFKSPKERIKVTTNILSNLKKQAIKYGAVKNSIHTYTDIYINKNKEEEIFAICEYDDGVKDPDAFSLVKEYKNKFKY